MKKEKNIIIGVIRQYKYVIFLNRLISFLLKLSLFEKNLKKPLIFVYVFLYICFDLFIYLMNS
jgi:hypothetical protein